jgi:RND family efflux transporter MFP subunit
MLKLVIAVTVIVVSLSAGPAAVGWWRGQQSGASHASADASATYICPMHPDYRSDHPGDCPICGMRLEAQRQSASNGAATTTRTPPIGVGATNEQQQAIGIRIGVVTRSTSTQLLRTTGRVVPDENRTYPIVAAVSGSIRSASSVTTGDAVKKDQILASFFSPDAQLDSAQQSYYEGLEMLYRNASAPPQAPSHGRSAVEEVERLADALRSLGVSNSQVRQLAVRRELVHDIRIESPADGSVLKRNVAPGLRFDRGFEFYRIADLSRVWILADISRDQLPFIRRGSSARITDGNQTGVLKATVSRSDPTFDETTQTVKVRLEATNPRATLKPGMFVDVELPLDLPAAVVVPADAIVDSGLRKTVFVECRNGEFEPRLIETGWRNGDEIAVTKGLTAGERIVMSGTFFIDSESRMKAAVKR